MLDSEVSPREPLLAGVRGSSAPVGNGWAAHSRPAPAALGGICIKGLVTWLRAWTPVKCILTL